MVATPLRAGRRIGDPRRPLLFWLAVGWVGFALLPWYGVEEGILDPAWLIDGWAWDDFYAPGLFQGLWHDKPWLLPHVLFLTLPVLAFRFGATGRSAARILIFAGAGGLAWWLAQGFGVGLRGIQWDWLRALLGPMEIRQFGMGWGALLTACAFLFILTQGHRGPWRGQRRCLRRRQHWVGGGAGRSIHPLPDAVGALECPARQ